MKKRRTPWKKKGGKRADPSSTNQHWTKGRENLNPFSPRKREKENRLKNRLKGTCKKGKAVKFPERKRRGRRRFGGVPPIKP